MVHFFEKDGMLLALDTPSGAVHVLDAAAYALLSAMPPEDITAGDLDAIPAELIAGYGEEAARAALAELASLSENGMLFSADDYSQYASSLGLAPVKAICLHLAHDCNLRCRYCFASTGGFGGQRKLMSLDVAKAAIDMLVQQSGTRRNLEVDFFGGEPLMNFDVLKQTVEYARGLEAAANKHFRFTVTTNGLALNDEIIEYVNHEMDNVVLSLDGRKETNDYMRFLPGGGSAYDAIVPSFQKLVQTRAGKDYYVRGTFTHQNLDFDKDVLALHGLGFEQISVEPVVADDTESYALQPADLPAIAAGYNRLMRDMTERENAGKSGADKYNFFHFMVDLANGPCAIKRLKGCGSGNEYVAVTPDGEIYPCHQFVGDERFIMGNVFDKQIDEAMKVDFADANLLHKAECADCWAKYFCSGGCNANNFKYEGDILAPHKMSCELEKMRLECAIAFQAAKAINEAENRG